MTYNFDNKTERINTDSVKYDLRRKVFGTEDVIPMWVADMDLKTPKFIREAVKERAEHEIYGYSYRPESYYKSITNWLETQHNWKIHSKEISFSPGVVPGLVLSVLAFTQPGDKIIVQPPVYFPFFTSIKDNGRQIVNNELINKDGYYSMNFENLISQIDSRTSMIIISNPHNPVGRAWKKEELEELVNICVKNKILIVSDEIHSDLVFAPAKHIPLASVSDEAKEIVITFMAPSKTFNMAGLSSSFAIIQNRKLRKIYNSYLDAYHLYLGNIFGNVATESAYNNGKNWVKEMKIYLEQNINYVHTFIEENLPQIKLNKPEATYLLWLDFSNLKLSDKELNSFLIKEAGLGLNQGSVFGMGGSSFMRMNVACPRETVVQAMDQLQKSLDTM